MIALSINLNAKPYEGGALQIRSAKTHEILCEVYNRNYGDAIIFPVDENSNIAFAKWKAARQRRPSLVGSGQNPIPIHSSDEDVKRLESVILRSQRRCG
jgi:hypothetical protein